MRISVSCRPAFDYGRQTHDTYIEANGAVYAAGDAAASGGPPLAPVASYEGVIVAANLLQGNHQSPNYLGIPSVVFTIPPLAAVGLSERVAREQKLKFRVKKEMTSTW